MFKHGLVIACLLTMACKQSSKPAKSQDEQRDTVKTVIVEKSPVENKELTGQELLDSFAEEYYIHYPDNVLVSEIIKLSDEIDPRYYYKNENYSKALELYKQQVIEYPNIPYVNFYTAMSAYLSGDYDTAIKHYDIVRNKFPENKYARVSVYYKGLSQLRKGEVENCKKTMNQYLDEGGIMTGRVSMLFQDLRLKYKPQLEVESQP